MYCRVVECHYDRLNRHGRHIEGLRVVTVVSTYRMYSSSHPSGFRTLEWRLQRCIGRTPCSTYRRTAVKYRTYGDGRKCSRYLRSTQVVNDHVQYSPYGGAEFLPMDSLVSCFTVHVPFALFFFFTGRLCSLTVAVQCPLE